MSDSSLEDLYQEVILDHHKHPRCKRVLEAPCASACIFNPLCGDEVTVSLRTEGARIAEIGFNGKGCSISQASASIMSELCSGRSLEEAAALQEKFVEMMLG